jgi:hypothetical protein
LKKHGCPVQEEKLIALEAAPARWEEVIRAAFDERERILPLQNVEMFKIRKKIDVFSEEVGGFRENFLKECPFETDDYCDVAFPEELQEKVLFYLCLIKYHYNVSLFQEKKIIFHCFSCDGMLFQLTRQI